MPRECFRTLRDTVGPQGFPAWIEEMEGRMRKNLAELRGPAVVSNRGPEVSAGSGSDGTERQG